MTKKDEYINYIKQLQLQLEAERAVYKKLELRLLEAKSFIGVLQSQVEETKKQKADISVVRNYNVTNKCNCSDVGCGKDGLDLLNAWAERGTEPPIQAEQRGDDIYIKPQHPLAKKFATPHNFTMTIQFDPPEFWEEVQ